MNIAIVGSSGYIAHYLRIELMAQGHIILNIDKVGNNIQFLDLENAGKFNYSILTAIDLIIFTAAISGPDKCADNFDVCWKINVDGTRHFIKEATARGCRVLFFSSDAVYGDIPGITYTEDSETKGMTAYGRMKRAIEDEFKNNQYFKALRLSYVISARDRFISYCTDCIRNSEIAEIFHPFYRNCVSVSDVVKVVIWFSIHFDEYKYKFLNVAGQELVSRVRMADELNRIFDNRLQYTISKPSENFFKNRPKITQMESLYMKEYGILEEESFTEKIQKEMEGVEL